MRSFFAWFKGSTKVKRWIFLILCGVALICYCFAKILVTKEMAISELIKIVIMFIIGLIYLLVTLNKPSFGSISYSVMCYIMSGLIIVNTVINILIRVFYRLIKHQKFDLKENRVYTIIQIVLFIICLIFFF